MSDANASTRPLIASLGSIRRLPTSVKISIAILAAFTVVGLIGPYIAPHDPTFIYMNSKLRPPMWEAGGSAKFPLGTDGLSRDVLSRMLAGTQVTLLLVSASVLAAASLGTLMGLVSGMSISYPGASSHLRIIDAVLMRFTDMILSVPLVLVALLLAVVYGPSLFIVVCVMTFFLWASYARVIRTAAASVCSRSFVDLAVVAGVGPVKIAVTHVLNNVLAPLVVLATLQIGYIILLGAALDFLGAGVPPPAPTWGGMVADGRQVISNAWWVSTIPSLAIASVVYAANTLGDWLRDRLDPNLSAPAL